MCGIAICVSNDSLIKESFRRTSIDFLNHRGPDDHGIWEDESVCIAHTRLSILDLSSAGHQPMISSGGRYIITYNGEVYNHQELRNRFLSGVHFKGSSDTETILALYEKLGSNMPKHLTGMWAFAIWDKLEKRLFISRDRFGQKPIYWTQIGHTWLFASEIKLLLSFVKQPTLNYTAAVEYLSLGNYGHLGKDTFINEIKSFPPSHNAILDTTSTSLETKLFWEIPNIADNDKKDFKDQEKECLNGLVRSAVLSQTLSDVPVGMTLSGGIDSSVIAGVLANNTTVPIEVFSARNKGNIYDESPFAQVVIDYWKDKDKLRSNLIDMDTLSIREHLSEGLVIQEEPFGDPSILSHLQIMKAVHKKGIKVILGGQGSDEIFYGYDNMFHALAGSLLHHGKLATFIRLTSQLKLSKVDVARIILGASAPGLYVSSRRRSREQRRFFIKPELLKKVNDTKIHLARPDDFYDTWIESIRGVHLPHLVHYDDRNGMAFAIEGRMPFLDQNIIEFLASLKPEYFARQGVRKFLLKESCSDYLPTEIKERQDKTGFFAPIHEMIHKDINFIIGEFQDLVFPLKLIDEKTLWNDLNFYRQGGTDVIKARRIWRVYSLCKWLSIFKIGL